MGKPAYLHRKRWQDARKLDFLEYCRGLSGSQRHGKTFGQLALYEYGHDDLDDSESRKLREWLKDIYYYLSANEGIVFGCVYLPPDLSGNPNGQHVWCVAEQDWEKSQIKDRWLRNADGNLRRIFGDERLRKNWSRALDMPVRGLLTGHGNIEETGRELAPPQAWCPHCGARVWEAKFCGECGSKIHHG